MKKAIRHGEHDRKECRSEHGQDMKWNGAVLLILAFRPSDQDPEACPTKNQVTRLRYRPR